MFISIYVVKCGVRLEFGWNGSMRRNKVGGYGLALIGDTIIVVGMI